MNLHEYQGKELLNSFGVRIQRGIVVSTPEEAVAAANKLNQETGTSWWVIKAQIHAGGRGKGGGVKLAKSIDEVKSISNDILGMYLITPQTSAEGKLVNQVLIAEDVYYPGESETSEFYMSVLLNRVTGRNMIMYSTEGGMDIEKVAEETPEKIIKIWVDPILGLQDEQVKTLADGLGFGEDLLNQASDVFKKLYKCYMEKDTTMLEINPLVKTEDNNIVALDSKFNFDGNAMFRHPDVNEMEDPFEIDETELEAGKFNLNYIKLDGNVGCMVNGAGLAMATMDIIKLSGGDPANFLDVGGAASVETVKNGFKIILKDPNVKAILINIFGGIVRCDRVAKGVVQAVKELDLDVPVVVRLEGTNAIEAKDILKNSEVEIIPATTMQDAADKVVNAAIN